MYTNSIKYTISARGKSKFEPVLSFLDKHFKNVSRDQIESVFGFAEKCTLYGGRPAAMRQLSDADTTALSEAGIGFRIPITNHFFNAREYERNRPFLEKYHKKGNAVIILNDDLAKTVRQDFPLYKREASMIKNITTHNQIENNLKIFDTVVLPMQMNDNIEFLKEVEPKERVTLFATAGCAYTCPARTCYRCVSRVNKFLSSRNILMNITGFLIFPFFIGCSRRKLKRALLGVVSFDLDKFQEMGFTTFKLIRSNPFTRTCH